MSGELIVLDIDGVLADLTLGLTTRAHAYWGTPIVRGEDQPEWSFRNCLSDAQQAEIWAAIAEDPGFWRSLEPLVSADDTTRLRQLGHRQAHFVYLTNRSGHRAEEQTRDWLWDYGFPYGNIALVANKAEWLAGLDPVGIIEDAPHNIIAMQGADLPVTIMDRPYNREIAGPRVHRFADFTSQMMSAIAGVRKARS